jgi:hypothetical protein
MDVEAISISPAMDTFPSTLSSGVREPTILKIAPEPTESSLSSKTVRLWLPLNRYSLLVGLSVPPGVFMVPVAVSSVQVSPAGTTMLVPPAGWGQSVVADAFGAATRRSATTNTTDAADAGRRPDDCKNTVLPSKAAVFQAV